jgi:hypothetical protein
MQVQICYQSNKGFTQSFLLPKDYQGFISVDDVEQIAEGYRRENNGIEPPVMDVARSATVLARQRKQGAVKCSLYISVMSFLGSLTA